jgi:hypothetical protein
MRKGIRPGTRVFDADCQTHGRTVRYEVSGKCVHCVSEWHARWHENNREENLDRLRDYHVANAERLNAARRDRRKGAP